MRISKPVLALVAAAILLGIRQVSAFTSPQTASIGFDVALTLTKNADINFGTVTAGNASTYRISTAGAVTTVSGTGAYLSGATAAGNITIAGSSTYPGFLSVGGFVAQGGVTLSNARCSYNGGAEGGCSFFVDPGAGKTLLLGVDAAADGTQAAGATVAPTLTVTVNYP